MLPEAFQDLTAPEKRSWSDRLSQQPGSCNSSLQVLPQKGLSQDGWWHRAWRRATNCTLLMYARFNTDGDGSHRLAQTKGQVQLGHISGYPWQGLWERSARSCRTALNAGFLKTYREQKQQQRQKSVLSARAATTGDWLPYAELQSQSQLTERVLSASNEKHFDFDTKKLRTCWTNIFSTNYSSDAITSDRRIS